MPIAPAIGALVPTQALWTWTQGVTGVSPTPATVIGYPTNGGPTKTGLLPADLQSFIGLPLQIYGNPPQPIANATQMDWLRWTEDQIENETSIRLCQTWIAAPPTRNASETRATGLITSGGAGQLLGQDYDLAEPPYDFFFPRAQDEGWMCYQLRWRPLKGLDPDTTYTALRNLTYTYPLLNEYFRVPPQWNVEDPDYGLIRLVPATNVQMLPLFAMQLAFMGFAESVPGGLQFQYTAGLTTNDYNSSYSFMQELVLAGAAVRALASMQASVNWGATEFQTNVDGLMYRVRYSEKGAFFGPLTTFYNRYKDLLATAKSKVQGPTIGFL